MKLAVPIIAALSCAIAFSGCMYDGCKITDGTDLSAGISIPGTEGVAQVSFFNYLDGFRFGAAKNSGMECEFWGTNTFSIAWGLWESAQYKHFKAKVEPCETSSESNTTEKPQTQGTNP